MISVNPTQPAGFTLISRPGPRMQDAVIAAAAEMALADGQAEPAEHRSLLAFLKQHEMLAAFGRTATILRFAAEIDRAAKRHAAGVASSEGESEAGDRWQDLTARLRPLAGMEAARVVAAAAAHVARADGQVNMREIELLDTVYATLGLNHHAESAHA